MHLPDGADKKFAAPATLDASVVVDPEGRQLRLVDLTASLGGAGVQWDGIRPGRVAAGGRAHGPVQGHAQGHEDRGGAADSPADRFVTEAASVAGDAVLAVKGEVADGRLTGKMTADLGPLAIRYRADNTDYFLKPAGQPASVGLTSCRGSRSSWARTACRHHILAEADLKAPGVRLQAFGKGVIQADWEIKDPDAEGAARQLVLHGEVLPGSTLELRPTISDTAQALLLAPALRESLKDQAIEGSIDGVLVLALRPRVLHVDGNLDLTRAALRLSRGAEVPAKAPTAAKPAAATPESIAVFNKPAAMPARLALAIDIMPPEGDTLEAYLTKADLELGESALTAQGRVQVVRPGPGSPATAEQALALFKEGNLAIQADVRHSPALRRALPCLEGVLYSKADLDGPMTIALTFEGTALRGRVHVETDGTQCQIARNETVMKPAGTAATLRLDARYGEAPGELSLDALEMKLADSVVKADGRLLFDNPRLLALIPPSAWSMHLSGRAPDAAALASLFPARLGDMKPAGGVTFKLAASGDPVGAEIQSCDFAFDRARILWLGKPFALNGTVSYDGQRLSTADGLNIVAGQSDVTVVAYVVQPNRAPTGSVILRGKRLALNELLGLIQDSSERLAQWAAAAAEAEPAPLRRAAPAPLSEELALYTQRLLARARLSCEIQLDHFIFTVPEWKATYEPAGVTGEGRLADQRLVVSRLHAGLNDGTIDAEINLDFHGDAPTLAVTYEAKDLQMQENLKPFIESTFPGMQVFGKVTQRNSNTRSLVGKAYAKGHGETELTDGLLEGPSAPDYITAVLPNLKWTQYRFNRMVSHFTDKGNGDVDNQMTFYGKDYDAFIFGTSKADGHVQYTVGVDLTASLGLKESSQPLGKLPLMYYTGRIVGSKFAEMNIRYLLPHEFAYEAFVRHNLVEQLFIRRGELPPRLEPPPAAPIPATRDNAQP